MRYCIILGAILVEALMFAPPVAAQSSRAELSITPGTAAAGSVAKVSIRANAPVTLGALQFDLIYDPTVVRLKQVESGELIPAGLVESNIVQPGRARVALVTNEEIKGDGVLLIAEFEVLAGPARPTSISPEEVRGWDQTNNLPVNIAGRAGELTRIAVAPEAASEPRDARSSVWIYAAIGGAIVLSVLVYLLRRKS